MMVDDYAVALAIPAALTGRACLAEPAFHHDAARPQDGHLGFCGRTARHHGQVTPGEGLVGAHRDPEHAKPAELVQLVGGDAQAPGSLAFAQAALDGGPGALEQEPPGGDDRGGYDQQDQEGGEEPGRIQRQAFTHAG